jgi:hypothetical protein
MLSNTNYSGLFKSRDTTQEQVLKLERAINSAFELMKHSGVAKIPVSFKIVDNEYNNRAGHNQIINNSTLNGGDVYYSFENYAKDEIAFFIAKQSYEIITLVTGELKKEKAILPGYSIEIPADMKEGIEVSSRYFRNGHEKTANPNLNFVTKTEFYEKNRNYVREFAEFILESGLTSEEFTAKIKENMVKSNSLDSKVQSGKKIVD